MRTRQKHALDLAVSRRLVGTCWLVTSLGIATLQMRLLAQAWHQSGTALEPAVVASAWMLGAVISFLRQDELRGYGAGFVVIVFAWLCTPFISWHIAPALQPVAACVGMTACALILGLASTSWLSQRRLWPPVGERVLLCRGLVGSTVGLVLVWLLPGALWSAVVGLTALIPLLMLDTWPQSRSPLPATGGLVDRWTSRAVTRTAGGAPGLRLDRGALPRGWWISYLVARGRLGLTGLASFFAIIMGTVWSALPTPFAAALASAHQSGKLEWLLGGQLCALAVGFILLSSSTGRRGIGAANRLLPETWRTHARLVSLLLLLVMAAALLAIGLPFLQNPWSLATSFGIYTLAAMFWSLLLPRLRPSISTITLAHRHIYRQLAIPRLLPLRQREEDLVNRNVMLAEALLTAIATPVMGWLMDLFTVDRLVIVVGCVLMVSLAVAACVFSRTQAYQAHAQLGRWYGGSDVMPGPGPLTETVAEDDPQSLTMERNA